jgi:hypothetical protein
LISTTKAVSPPPDRRAEFFVTDQDGDGSLTDGQLPKFEDLRGAQGMNFLAPGDLLLHCRGPEDLGDGLYRLKDTDGDDRADERIQVMPSRGGIGEHGPHAILTGLDGFQYLLYGNHSAPDVEYEADSPLRGMREDYLLPRYTDPNGHAAHVRAPWRYQRLDLETGMVAISTDSVTPTTWRFRRRNLTYNSDMEWDIAFLVHPARSFTLYPAATTVGAGSSKSPDYYLDTLPPV